MTNKLKNLIGYIGFKMFLWSIGMTSEEYAIKQAKDVIKFYEEELRERG